MRISLCSSLWKIWKSWKSKKLFSSSSLKIGENSWIEGEMFNIIYCKLWKICELWYDGSRRNFIEAFLTKLVKSKDARSRSVHKISIVTHAIVASIVAGRGSHKAPLFSWARIPKSPLSRSGYTIVEGLRFGSIKQCHCFRVSLFLQTCCSSCAFSSIRKEREDEPFDFGRDFSIRNSFCFYLFKGRRDSNNSISLLVLKIRDVTKNAFVYKHRINLRRDGKKEGRKFERFDRDFQLEM